MTADIIGYIAAPTGAGEAYATFRGPGRVWGFRGRRPRWYWDLDSARNACRSIERDGRRDGGRGRDCYIVAVVQTPDGIEVRAGGADGGGLSLGSSEAPIGCSLHVADAVTWLRSRPARWLADHGVTP